MQTEDALKLEGLIQTARDEIAKLKCAEELNKTADRDEVVTRSIAFADNVIKRLVAHTLNKPVESLFDSMLQTRGSILIDDKYVMQLDIVNKDYMLDLSCLRSIDVRDHIVFLLNSVKVLFGPVMEHVRRPNDYTLQLGQNTTLFLDSNAKKRIGITLTLK